MIDTELTRENATADRLEQLAPSYPVPRLGTALEVADLICFAASEAAGYITGASLDINGGDLMMPSRRKVVRCAFIEFAESARHCTVGDVSVSNVRSRPGTPHEPGAFNEPRQHARRVSIHGIRGPTGPASTQTSDGAHRTSVGSQTATPASRAPVANPDGALGCQLRAMLRAVDAALDTLNAVGDAVRETALRLAR